MNSYLNINALELEIFLGWPKEERARKQIVKIDIHISFPETPSACQSDEINDTYCYRELIDGLRDKTAGKHFRLIEHLTQTIYDYFKSCLPDGANTQVSLTKHPQIQGLGSVTFHVGDAL